MLNSPNDAIYLGNSELIRKAENPFTFLKGQERLLSYIYLHFRYFYLLLLPIQLCAEYAFNCIPSVSEVLDIRNIYSFGMYVAFMVTVAKCLVNILFRRDKKNIGNINYLPEEGELIPKLSSDSEYVLYCLALMIVPFVPIRFIQPIYTYINVLQHKAK